MMTIINAGMKIIAGGCRYRARDGELRTKLCDICLSQGNTCELEPHARRLAKIAARGYRGQGGPALRAEYSVGMD